MNRNSLSSQKNTSIFDKLWLMYYNDSLYAKGIITENVRNKINNLIKNRGTNQTNNQRTVTG